MDIDRLDRIILSREDVDKLFEWRDKNKEYVKNFKSVLKTGVITVDDYHTQVFVENGSIYNYTTYHHDKVSYRLQWDKSSKIGFTLFSTFSTDMDEEEYKNSIISLHASLMAYMEYYSDKKEYVEVERINKTVLQNRVSKKNKSKNKKSPIRIKKTVYKVRIDENSIDGNIDDKASVTKNKYSRTADKWTVRGHWREYSNGNKVWIKPYVKGEGKEISPKKYKL